MSKRHRGSTLMMVLVLLAITGIVSAELAHMMILREHHSRLTSQRRQAQLLAEAAGARALLMLQQSPEYRGDVWQSELPDGPSTAAEVQVEERAIQVLARIGEGTHAVTCRLTLARGESE